MVIQGHISKQIGFFLSGIFRLSLLCLKVKLRIYMSLNIYTEGSFDYLRSA